MFGKGEMRDGNDDIVSMHVCMFARARKLEHDQFYLYLLCFDDGDMGGCDEGGRVGMYFGIRGQECR